MTSVRQGWIISILLLAATCHSAFSAPPVEPGELSSIKEGERTQLLILASPHLSVLGTDFNPKAADPLVTRLQSFAPDAVAVEALPPSVMQSMQAQGEPYRQVLERYARQLHMGKKARETLNLSYKEVGSRLAEAEMQQPRDNRELALLFLAMNDWPSAVLHWAYLDEAARKGGDGVPAEIAEFLSGRVNSPNETYAVAVPLAKRLGQVRLIPIDDHSDKDLYVTIAEELDAALKKDSLLEKARSAEIYKKGQKILAASNRNGDLTAAYRFFNSTGYARQDIEAQWDIFVRTQMKGDVGRVRLALWDVRNLMIASHIRRLTAQHPGGRILVIIGAAHKPFLEAYLRQAMDIRLVAAAAVLDIAP